MRVLAAAILLTAALMAVAGPWLAPHAPGRQFRDHLLAPPMRIRLVDEAGTLRAPFAYPWRLVDRVERRYVEDRTRRLPLVGAGRAERPGDAGTLFLLGTDSLGRDLFSRLLAGARLSLGVAVVAVIGALGLGAVLGGVAGARGGFIDETLMRLAEFILVLPAIYLILVLRAMLPLVLSATEVFALTAGLLALAGWPYVARGVRAIVVSERRRDYAEAALALGATRTRLLVRHLLPATSRFLITQAVLLLPAFIVAEATLSFVGLGFAEPTPSWGVMLQEAANIRALADFPWLLAPAAAIAGVVLALNLLAERRGAADILTLQARVVRRPSTPRGL